MTKCWARLEEKNRSHSLAIQEGVDGERRTHNQIRTCGLRKGLWEERRSAWRRERRVRDDGGVDGEPGVGPVIGRDAVGERREEAPHAPAAGSWRITWAREGWQSGRASCGDLLRGVRPPWMSQGLLFPGRLVSRNCLEAGGRGGGADGPE
ncbi:hypothetical protein Tco_1407848 [Tanacetum coccineum]|uniref:Uncharacterized protein n=1 Tax=Tanacetum coccineum TaxID=301880 RepID=A0ABQ5GNA2_9ASTR